MMKKNKLYTVNKWNREALGEAVEKTVPYPTENLFYVGGDVGKNVLAADRLASQLYGANYGEAGNTLNDYMNSTNAFGLSKADNPFSKMNIQGGIGAMANTGIGKGVLGAVGSVGNRLAYNTISGGLSSGAGKAVGNITNTIGGALANVNPVIGMGVQVIGGAIGGGINALGGTAVDEKKKAANDAGTAALNNFTSNAESFDDIHGPQAVANVQDAHKSGAWRKGWARRRNAADREARANAIAFADRSISNNIYNIAEDQLNDALANYSAFGGPIEQIYNDDMGAINYDFMDRYLTAKEAQNKQKNQMTNLFAGTPSTMFDLGGVLQNHGADWSTGLTHVNAGGTHEESPYDGVQMGVDPQGIPNLVEENETVYNDYVFSNRIMADDATKQIFHLPKKKDITYADISKKLEKEITERPNDPISKAGFNAQMQKLQEQQERQKAEMDAEKAEAAFEALSPEEKVAVMQQAQQQEQVAQEAVMQEQANMPVTQPEQAEMPVQGSPEEMAMQEQMAQQEAPVMAYGGKVNKYPDGGEMKKYFSNMLKLYTDSDIAAWAKENNVGDIDWKNVLKNENFVKAITKGNPALADAISRGYDFGAYVPGASGNVTFDNDRGNWDMQTVQGWWGSQDPAWLEVIKNHPEITKDTQLDKKTLENYLSETDAFKKGTAWLQASPENRLAYLQAIFNNPNAPIKAKQYAQRFIDENGWKQGAATDYDTIFNNPSGRAANPGTYWKTPIGVVRNAQVKNLVQNADGNWEEIIGDVPTDWTSVGNYSWATPENDLTYNYYRRPGAQYNADNLYGAPWAPGATRSGDTAPATGTAGTDTTKKGAATGNEEEFEVEPNYRAEWPRYAGLFGPAVGLGLQLAGVGKPDTSGIEAAANSVGNAYLADYKPIGNYLTYRPMDIWFEQNRMDANARATDRNILNTSGGNRGTAVAGMLANGYNSQIADGELYRKALEYNDALRERTETFNRGTNQFNADAYNRLSQFNADALNRNKQYSAQLAMQAAREKMDADAGWYNSLYGNIGGLFKGISDLGRENTQHNMIAEMAANGIFGTMSPKTHVGRKGKYITIKTK